MYTTAMQFVSLMCTLVCVVAVPCNLETSRSLQTACHESADCAGAVTQTTCTCGLWRDNLKETESIVMIYSVVLYEKLGGHFGSRESSSSQQPFIPCEQTCHCLLFPPITSKKTNKNHCQKDRGYFPIG